MIKYLSNTEIDRNKWAHCIENRENKLIYADADYLDLVFENWGALVKDDYVAVMPLFPAKKLGFNYLTQAFYVQQSGVFSTEKTEFIRTEDFFNALPDNFKFIDIQLNFKNLAPKIKLQRKTKRVNQLLYLNNSYENLQKRFSDSHKKNIRRAIKCGLFYEEFDDSDIFFSFKKHNKSNYQESIDVLKKIDSGLRKKQFIRYFGVKNQEGNWISVAMFIEWKNRLTWLSSGTTESGKESKAMFYLVDNIINKYAGKDIYLDFAGSTIPGVWAFNNGFGAKEEIYYRISINKLPAIIRWLKK